MLKIESIHHVSLLVSKFDVSKKIYHVFVLITQGDNR